MTIREAELGDAERIALAHSIAADESYGHYFPEDWMQERNTPAQRTEQWIQTLTEYQQARQLPGATARIVIAEDADRVLGFGIFGAAREADAPFAHELHRLYVLSHAYGSGLAHRLFAAVHPEQTSSYLWVMEANTRAIAFYRKYGFEPDGALENLTTIGYLPKIRMVRSHAFRGPRCGAGPASEWAPR